MSNRGQCDLTNSKSVSISTQASLAGVVLSGEVEQVFRMRFEQIVTLRNVKYFKGCGPSEVRVYGFKLNSDCHVEAPKIGTKTVIFGCDGKDEIYPIVLNDIGNYTGAYVWTPMLQTLLETIIVNKVDQLKCDGRFTFMECGSLVNH